MDGSACGRDHFGDVQTPDLHTVAPQQQTEPQTLVAGQQTPRTQTAPLQHVRPVHF
jgi:hypothetical protein